MLYKSPSSALVRPVDDRSRTSAAPVDDHKRAALMRTKQKQNMDSNITCTRCQNCGVHLNALMQLDVVATSIAADISATHEYQQASP